MSRNTPWRTARRTMNLYQPGNNDWYRIRNAKEPGAPTQIHIYDEIGYFGVGASEFVRDLADVTGAIELHLNSPGGEVFDGIAIYNALMARKDVSVVIDGLAASIASVIACAGNPILIAKNAQIMIHEGHAMAIGNAADLRDLSDLLDKTSNNIASIYADHTGKPQSYWRQKMQAETWFDAQEAIDNGLADRFLPSGAGRQVREPQDNWDMSIFRGAASVPYVGREQSLHRPMTGTHTHDHAAFGQGDHDDGIHGHKHTHNNDADHDHDHDSGSSNDHDADDIHDFWSDETVPQGILVVHLGMSAQALFDSWDGDAAMKRASNAKNPASAFSKICAGRRAGDKSQRGTWALPHHDSPDAGPNPDGVKAALGRWNQTQGLENKEAALKHLQAHMRQINPDWKPDDHMDVEQYTDEDVQKFLTALRG